MQPARRSRGSEVRETAEEKPAAAREQLRSRPSRSKLAAEQIKRRADQRATAQVAEARAAVLREVSEKGAGRSVEELAGGGAAVEAADRRVELAIEQAERKAAVEAELRLKAEHALGRTERRLNGLVERLAREAERRPARGGGPRCGQSEEFEREAKQAADQARKRADEEARRARTSPCRGAGQGARAGRGPGSRRSRAARATEARLEREAAKHASFAAEARREVQNRRAELAERLRREADGGSRGGGRSARRPRSEGDGGREARRRRPSPA